MSQETTTLHVAAPRLEGITTLDEIREQVAAKHAKDNGQNTLMHIAAQENQVEVNYSKITLKSFFNPG